eukprot:m.54869 g.54869  ORF g.54869 m.54869 type:complete len:437 (+) comp7562_c0_seq1:209-1519(+)
MASPSYEEQHRQELIARGFDSDEVDDLLLDVPSYSSSSDTEDEGTSATPPPKPVDTRPLRERYAQSLDLMQVHAAHHRSDAEHLADEAGRAMLCELEHDPPMGRRIAYYDATTLDPATFTAECVVGNNGQGTPAMLTGVVDADEWRATTRWSSSEAFIEHYGSVPVKVWDIASLSGFGKPMPVHLPIELYHEYAETNTADFPYYVFLKEFAPEHTALREDYKVPALFKDDLYNVTPQVRRFFRQHAYFIMGGARTGSNMHVDPQYTCAWNTLLCGLKRWVMFPPGESDAYRAELGLPTGENPGVSFAKRPPAVWWRDVHAKLVCSGRATELGMIEAVQRPGDTIFVPRGWHHAVLNLGWTVAVTQNLILPAMLPDVLGRLRVKFPRFAARWARALRSHHTKVWEQYGDNVPAEDDALLPGEVDDEDELISDAELFC